MKRCTAVIGALLVAALALAAGSLWAATINGTPRNDTLRGTPRADAIHGKGGNDRLYGAGGNDVLAGGAGNDILVGGAGADTLRCGPGRDTAIRDLRDSVAADCERVRGPRPVLPPPAPPPAPPSPPALPVGATFKFGPTISAAERTSIERMVATVFQPLVAFASVPGDLAFTVVYDVNIETLAQEFSARTGNTIEFSRQVWTHATAVGMSGALIVNAASSSWAPANESSRSKIMAHEIYHVAQHAWMGGNFTGRVGDHAVPRGGPWWLLEGSAEFIAYRATAAAGLLDFASARAEQIRQSRNTAAPLRELELLAGMNRAGQAAYPLSFLAAEFLIRERGPAALPSFWRSIASGKPWQLAFADEFGRSVDAFYAEFEAYRQGL